MFTEEAFDTETIVKTHQSALHCRAITEICALTVAGRLYIQRADHVRYNADKQTGEIYVAGEWIEVLPIGVALWATRENLNWRMPDGRVLRPDEPLRPPIELGEPRAPVQKDMPT